MALRDSVKILNEDPGHFRTRVLLGRIYLRQKAFDNAIAQPEAALVTRPDYPEPLYFLGQAAEKRGSAERAHLSYSRYLEVLPDGPRAERLREWLQGHASTAGTASQMQCELCLRFFPGSEISQHEGKATCRNCLVVMKLRAVQRLDASGAENRAHARRCAGNRGSPGRQTQSADRRSRRAPRAWGGRIHVP